MTAHIIKILSTATVVKLTELLDTSSFQEGTKTAQGNAKLIKYNLQLANQQLSKLIVDELITCQQLAAIAIPNKLSAPMFNLYEKGMYYGPHIDVALMNHPAGQVRTDMSMTICLSDPTSYEGGELCITDSAGLVSKFKPTAGEAVLYEGGLLHEVAPVTAGKRLACIIWIQSHIKNHEQRRLLSEFDETRSKLEPNLGLNKLRENLRRLWSD